MMKPASPKDHIVLPCREEAAVLYQDEHLLLVSKPAGLLSVPGKHPANRDCLISRLQQTFPEARIVHRLDLDTSGIMVVALCAESHRALSRQFEQREVKKEYEAIVFGRVEQNRGLIDLPLICDWSNRPRQKVDHVNGKAAQTIYEVISRDRDRTLVRLRPITGRSHQLRVHLAAIGHPILGCNFYAHPEAFEMSSRLLLHATKLSLQHPVTRQTISHYSPRPF